MMFLKPDGKIDLEHRACFLRGAPPHSAVIAAAEHSQLSILSKTMTLPNPCATSTTGKPWSAQAINASSSRTRFR